MAGLLNSTQAAPNTPTQAPQTMQAQPVASPSSQGMQGPSSLSDPTLQKIEQGIESKLVPAIKQNYISCVNAGMSAMFGPQTGQRVIAKLKSSTNITSDIVTGIANIFATIYNEIAAKMPPQQRQQFLPTFLPALIAASSTLTCHALDTAEKLGKLQVNPQMAAQVIHDAAMACLQKLGIGQQQIQQVTAKHGQNMQQGSMQQPNSMQLGAQ